MPTELIDGRIKTYIEPFIGSGAVLIEVLQKYDVEKAIAFDINADLINTYLVVKNNLKETFDVIENLYNINDMKNGIMKEILK